VTYTPEACIGRVKQIKDCFLLEKIFILVFYIFSSKDLPSIRLVGNLPLNMSIPLLLQWLQAISHRAGPSTFGRVPMSLVFQKEVVDVSW
jgi:16S rRNA A1518/A1519 N6-dimethyltransferase RsmA/KsgA/DIM1 with predicted DNA glycosylase/AP lyase activity